MRREGEDERKRGNEGARIKMKGKRKVERGKEDFLISVVLKKWVKD